MTKAAEILGQKFGKWLVLEKTHKRDSRGQIVWRCKCECGRERGITYNQLKFKRTVGCFRCNRRRPVSPRPTLNELIDNSTQSETDCFIWKGSFSRHDKWGYAIVYFKDERGRITHKVSRLILEEKLKCCLLKSGFACHTCDNPKCINPEHLFLGDAVLNPKDAAKKGRMARGENHGSRLHPERVPRGENSGRAMLTEKDVKIIRDSPLPSRLLAKNYGVGKSTIQAVKNRESWAWLK